MMKDIKSSHFFLKGEPIDRETVLNLIEFTDGTIEELTQCYNHPFKLICLRFYSRILKLLSSLRICFPARQRERFRRSSNKRSGHKWKKKWEKLQLSLFGFSNIANFTRNPFCSGILPESSSLNNCILVTDYRIPREDVSAGEKATVGLIHDLILLGFEVTFVPADMQETKSYAQQLRNMGVKLITARNGYFSLANYIQREGHSFGTFYFIRVDVAEKGLLIAENVAPYARKIFHAPDLYFLRETREAEFSGSLEKIEKAQKTLLRELAMMKLSDHVVIVSPAELPVLREHLPEKSISVFPALYAPVVDQIKAYEDRKDIFFLGGFFHTPNVDSVLWFAEDVWPSIHKALPDVTFYIVGAQAPESVKQLGEKPGIQFVGYVEDLAPLLEKFRIGVAPLLYGAGIKGKVAMTMGAGVPCVCTTIAAEGMAIIDAQDALIADKADDFANAVVKLYLDKTLWNKISENGRKLVNNKFSESANRADFMRTLQMAKALPVNIYKSYIAKCQPEAFPAYENDLIDVSIIVPVYNKWELTEACLKSIIESCRGTSIQYEVILADDGSTDLTLKATEFFPNLKISHTPKNSGFLLNCNNAAQSAKGRYLLFLNNDTIVFPNWLDSLYSTMESDMKIAIAGSKLLYPDGSIQDAGALIFSDGSGHSYRRGTSRYDKFASFARETDYVTGASFLIRASFWNETGGFDKQFQPAYCEDSDFCMTARQKGYSVFYVPQSEVIHFEHGSYGEETIKTPKEYQLQNKLKLVKKWEKVLAKDHLSPEIDPICAAAHAERHSSSEAFIRNKKGKLNVLYFSPFPSHPNSHGNSATIQSFAKKFQDMGHKIHFALLKSNFYTPQDIESMQLFWDSLDIIPNKLPLESNGKDIPFDGWYEEGLGQHLYLLCHQYDIDVVFFSYIFQSKMLEYVPRHIKKIVDTHDKMGDRYEMLRKNNQPLEFFSCTQEEEGRYLRRADIVVARRREEADYFDKVMKRKASVVIPHLENSHFTNRQFKEIKRAGIVASANRINLISVLDFIRAYSEVLSDNESPIEIYVAGQVKDLIPSLTVKEQAFFKQPWLKMIGFVPDIADFYQSVDIIIAPIMMGTGINVKTVQAMAYGMPLLTTSCGSKGIETGDEKHLQNDIKTLARTLLLIKDNGRELNRLSQLSKERYTTFSRQFEGTITEIISKK